MENHEKTALEIYFAIRSHPGALSSISGYLQRNDSSKISRQLNPADSQRDNPFTEILSILEAVMSFSPDLEEQLWQILERARNRHRKGLRGRRAKWAELLNRIFPELGDVVFCSNTNAPADDMEREVYQLLKAVEELYNNIRESGEMIN